MRAVQELGGLVQVLPVSVLGTTYSAYAYSCITGGPRSFTLSPDCMGVKRVGSHIHDKVITLYCTLLWPKQ